MNLLFLFYKFDVCLSTLGLIFLLASVEPNPEITVYDVFKYLAFYCILFALASRIAGLLKKHEWMMEKHKKQEHQARINKDKVMVELLEHQARNNKDKVIVELLVNQSIPKRILL
jgi:hypothetical protein